jgi:hypothetical protein
VSFEGNYHQQYTLGLQYWMGSREQNVCIVRKEKLLPLILIQCAFEREMRHLVVKAW